MGSKNLTELTDYAGGQSSVDLMYIAASPFAPTDDRNSTLNDLFAYLTKNITDKTLRFQASSSPAVSASGQGALTFNGTNFQISQNGGAYANVGNITTTGFTSTRVPIANGANTLTDDAGLTFNTATDFLTVGTPTGGGIHFLGSNGNTVALAAQAPAAASYLYYLPNAAPTAGQALYAATVGVQTQLGWTTINGGSGAANQVTVWSATNTLSGSSALTFTSGVLAISGTASPGVVATNTAAGDAGFTANQSVSGTASYSFYQLQTPSTAALVQLTTAGYTPANLVKANQLRFLGAASTVEMLFDLADASRRFVFGVNNVEAASINATSTLGLVLGVASTLTGRVRMYNSAGTAYSQISAGNAASSLNFIWPVVNPTSGQVLTASAPSGSDVTLSWTTPSGGASLTATQVGFGSGANALTGSADFTYTDATGVLDLTKTGLNSSVRMTVANASAGSAAQARFGASANVSGAALIAYSSTFTTSGLRTANSAVLDLDGTTSVFLGQSAGQFKWGLGSTEYARMTTTVFTLFGSNTGSVTGLSVTSSAAGNGVTLAALSSNPNEGLTVAVKGSAQLDLSATVARLFGSGSPELRLQDTNAATQNPWITFYDNSTRQGMIQYSGTASRLELRAEGTNNLLLRTTAGNYVGVSASAFTPITRLHINESSSSIFMITRDAIDPNSWWHTISYDPDGVTVLNPGSYTIAPRGPGAKAADFAITTRFPGAPNFVIKSNAGNVGINTLGPDRQLEINSASGANLRLTYNDADGSAANYTDFTLSSTGALTLTSPQNEVLRLLRGGEATGWVMGQAGSGGAIGLAQGDVFSYDNGAAKAWGLRTTGSGNVNFYIKNDGSVGLTNGAATSILTPGATLHLATASGNPVFRQERITGAQANQFDWLIGSNPTGSGNVLANASLTVKPSVAAADFAVVTTGIGAVDPSLIITATNNIGLCGAKSWGTGAVRVVASLVGTPPSTSVTDTTQHYTADAAADDAQALVRNEAGRIARLTGTLQCLNQSFPKTNATLANVTGSGANNDLLFNVETGSTYRVRVALQLDAEFAAGGVKIALGGTVTLNTTISGLSVQIWRNDTNAIAASGRITNTGSSVSASGAADGSTYTAVIEGSIFVTTGGTLTVQFAQASASGTSNVLPGSYFEIARHS